MIVLNEETTNELDEATKVLDSIDKDIDYYKGIGHELTRTQRKLHYTTVSQILDIVGALSIPIFEARESIEDHYRKKYIKQPALGKTLWLKEYDKLHKPFDRLKNRCWSLLKKLDPKEEFEYETI